MQKRKRISKEPEESEKWVPFVETLEKPGVQNRFLEYLCRLKWNGFIEKQFIHRAWINTITEISKRHSSVRIRKLAKSSVDNYKVTYNILYKVEQKLVCSLCIHPLS
jgi:hypothetical protein